MVSRRRIASLHLPSTPIDLTSRTLLYIAFPLLIFVVFFGPLMIPAAQASGALTFFWQDWYKLYHHYNVVAADT